VVIPYGSDPYEDSRIRSTGTQHGLLISYPDASRRQMSIRKSVEYWTRKCDVLIPGFMGPDGFGRWDVLVPSAMCISLDEWPRSMRGNRSDGLDFPVVVAHAPNHRGFKGSKFVIDAISELQREGLLVELRLLEGLRNDEVKRVLSEETDILVE